MGNKPSYVDMRHGGFPLQDINNNLRVHLSEEDYLPMPLVMRKALLEGRRFQHVLPSRLRAAGTLNSGNGSDRKVKTAETSMDEQFPDTGGNNQPNDVVHIEPVVTVVGMVESQHQLFSPQVKKAPRKDQFEVSGETSSFTRSPTLSNRRHSLIDLKTGARKSLFTLQLEEKLRQSKLELGFDNDLNECKEFTYKIKEHEPRRRSEQMTKENLNLTPKNSFSRDLEKVSSRDPLQNSAHKCQILGLCSVRKPELGLCSVRKPELGLCSVRKPELFPGFEPSVFKDEISRKYDMKYLLMEDTKHYKEDCNCDLCTLAYLTEMAFPEERDPSTVVSVEKGRQNSGSCVSSRHGGGDITEKIKIIDSGNSRRSIEISVSNRQSTIGSPFKTSDLDSSPSFISTETTNDDCTNLKIKKMFQENNNRSPLLEETNNKGNLMYNDINIINLSTTEQTHGPDTSYKPRARSVDTRSPTSDLRRSPVFKRSKLKGEIKHSSSSILVASVSSSLSTILSYKRLRKMFQTIIEKNRPRKKTKKNIHKFREMEELGLGEVKNNRWYPSDSKTFSIWNEMHSNVHGVQAQFKKYPKTTRNS